MHGIAIHNLNDIFGIQISSCMFLYTKGLLAESLKTTFSANSSIHSHNTRHYHDHHVVKNLTCFIIRTLIHCAPKVLLDIHNNIWTVTSLGQFINFALFIFTRSHRNIFYSAHIEQNFIGSGNISYELFKVRYGWMA